MQELSLVCELERINPEANSNVTFWPIFGVGGGCRGKNELGDDLDLDVIRYPAELKAH